LAPCFKSPQQLPLLKRIVFSLAAAQMDEMVIANAGQTHDITHNTPFLMQLAKSYKSWPMNSCGFI